MYDAGMACWWPLALLPCCVGAAEASSVTQTGSGSKGSFYTGGTPGGTPVQGGKAVIDLAEAPATLDPVGASSTTNAELSLQMAEGSVETVPGSSQAHPDLATSWTISPNGRTYVFHIREGVKFSNGEPLTGEDVVYTLERQRLPIAAYGSFLVPYLKKISLVNPMTVQVQLTQAVPSLLSTLTFGSFGIVPKHVVQREGEKAFALHPVGVGPFMLKSASPGFTTVTMARNPHYWRSGQPYLDELVFNQVAESNARILAVRSGTATIDLSVPFSQAASLQKTASGDRVLIEPILSEELAQFNPMKAPFTNVNVRKALNYATPRAAIIKAALKGLGTPANNVPSDLTNFYDPNIPTFPYDIAKAKELLKDSPVPHGFNMSLMLFSGEPTSTVIASILQSSWAQIGVKVSLRPLPPTTFLTEDEKFAYQMFLWTPELLTAESYEPDLFGILFSGPSSFFKVKSSRLQKIVEEATAVQSNTRRAKLWTEYQRLFSWEEAREVPIAFVPQINLVSGSLRGYTYPANNQFHMGEAWLAH